MASTPHRFGLMSALLWLLLRPVHASSIATWWYESASAPQVMQYDQQTGRIYYSLCNSNSTPVFALNDSTALPWHDGVPPISGTSIAGLGYLDGDLVPTNVFYLMSVNGETAIVDAIYSCNLTTGHYFIPPSSGQSAWAISNGTGAPEIDPLSSLAVINLGATDGYRVYFTTTNQSTAFMQYLPNANAQFGQGWSFGGYVSPSVPSGRAIDAGFVDSDLNEVTVVSPLLEGLQVYIEDREAWNLTNIEFQIAISTDEDPYLWAVDTYPDYLVAYDSRSKDGQTLDVYSNMTSSFYDFLLISNTTTRLVAFNSTETSIGLSLDSFANPSVWYIGTDKGLHQVSADSKGVFSIDEPRDLANWPDADEENADFSVAYDATNDRIWLYYTSGDSMTQVYKSGKDQWEAATALPASAGDNSSTAETGSGGPAGDPNPGAGPGPGLSGAAKAGLGVGLGLGIALIASALVAAFLSRRARRAKAAAAQAAGAEPNGAEPGAGDGPPPSTLGLPGGSPAPQYADVYGAGSQGRWEDGQWVPVPFSDKSPSHAYASMAQGYPRYNNAGGGDDNRYSELPAVPVYEMPHVEAVHEMPSLEFHRAAGTTSPITESRPT